MSKTSDDSLFASGYVESSYSSKRKEIDRSENDEC